MSEETEEWRKVWEFYEVSNLGRVRHYTGRQLKPQHTDARPSVTLSSYDGGAPYRDYIDELVLAGFDVKRSHDHYVPVHLDGDLTNCKLTNLAWGERVRAKPTGRPKVSDEVVDSARAAVAAGESVVAVARRLGVSRGWIHDVVSGRRRK